MKEQKSGTSANRKATITGLLITGILVLIYILSQWIHTSFDATEERRYTLTPATKEILRKLEDRIYIQVLLAGRFPAGFARLQESTADLLRQFRQINPDVAYNFENPNEGTVEEINARRKELAAKGIIPTQLRVSDASAASTQYIYPYAIIHTGSRSTVVSLLQDDIPGADKELILNNSIALLEYKFADGIQKVLQYAKKEVCFSAGQGELSPLQTASIEKDLREAYRVTRINLDSFLVIPDEVQLLIVAKPTEKFSEAHLFMLDQFVMRGGRIMFLVDPLIISLDSINRNKLYIPPVQDVGLDPLFFKWGARVNPDLVLDLQCTRIPMVVGMQGDKVQTELYPWYYHPLVSSTSSHMVSKGLDRIQLEFPGSIDTVQTSVPVKKTFLLQSSEHTRIQLTPVRLNFNILQETLDPALFNKGPKPFALLLEGKFESAFKNRLSAEQLSTLEKAGVTFRPTGDSARILIVTDGDIIKNLVNSTTGDIAPLGFNKYENTTFTGNRDFLLNATEYLLGNTGLLEARTKDIKLRLLNSVKAREEGLTWQLINILGPIVLIILLGLVYRYLRKRKYGVPA